MGVFSFMRWALATIFFIIAVFGFFVGYAVGSLVLSEFDDALRPHADKLSTTNASDNMTLLKSAFGVIGAIIFVVIAIVFGMESLSDEPEQYWRR